MAELKDEAEAMNIRNIFIADKSNKKTCLKPESMKCHSDTSWIVGLKNISALSYKAEKR